MIGPLPYIGGKRAIANQIIAAFPKEGHTTYVEPFAGGAQVFFRKQPSKVEVLNDLDHEIVTLYRVYQAHQEEFLRYLRYMLVSRRWYELLKTTDPGALTDIQRAARYFYLLKNSYGGLVRDPRFHVRVTESPGLNPERLAALIEETHTRLARVQIECLPYEKVLEKYDRPTTLFYVDPPYYAKRLYRYNLTHDEFVKMAEHLDDVRGKFVLSLNDVPEVRAIFDRFRIRDITLAYTAQKVAGRRFREVLITNF